MVEKYRTGIVGATGAVGRELLRILGERNFPADEIILLASERSEGEKIPWAGDEIEVKRLKDDSFKGMDLVFFTAGSEVSKKYAPLASACGAVVIDNSSLYRLEPDVPLIVPEVNREDIAGYESRNIIANPNCSTIQMIVGVAPLHRSAGLTRLRAATYQSVSGAGQKGIDELSEQVRHIFNGLDVKKEVFPHRIAFNVIPQIDSFRPNGYTGEEMKMVEETRKILHLPDLPISATCVRIPVFFGHSEVVGVETSEKLSAEKAREILEQSPGIKILDDPESGIYPMPLLASGDDATLIGRIREDLSHPNGIELFIVSDNIRKGAALNAVQIAECLVQDHFQ